MCVFYMYVLVSFDEFICELLMLVVVDISYGRFGIRVLFSLCLCTYRGCMYISAYVWTVMFILWFI